jgi:hypothetical protein
VEAIKKLQWQCRQQRGLPTIVLQRRAGYITTVRATYGNRHETLSIGPRIATLAGYLVVHAKTEHSTEVLSDALGISGRSLKEYFLRLRTAFDGIRVNLGCPLTGREVFWTRRAVGGHTHGLKANVEIKDSEDYYFPDEEYDAQARLQLCAVCRSLSPREQTTRFRTGSLCVDCCRDLQELGEL